MDSGYCSFPLNPLSPAAHGTICEDLTKFSNLGQRLGEGGERKTKRKKKGKGIWGDNLHVPLLFPSFEKKERKTFHSNTLFKTTALTEK